jgi:hypothetical protein
MAVERVLDIRPPDQHVAEARADHHDDPLRRVDLPHQPGKLIRHQLARGEMVGVGRLEAGRQQRCASHGAQYQRTIARRIVTDRALCLLPLLNFFG